MPIAAWTLHIPQDDADGGFRITRLNMQIQINHRAATVAGDNQPMMF
jgi:hypothetical protein